MRCSNCSEIVRPVAVIDIDGTLGQYHHHFMRFAADWLGNQNLGEARLYDGTEPFSEWCCRAFGIDKTRYREIKLAYRQGGMKRTMPVYPYAKALCDAVYEVGAELWLNTSRPHDRYDRVDPDTREWLRRHEIPFNGLLFAEDDKMGALRERIDPQRVCFVFDDLPEVLQRAQDLFPSAGLVLRANGFNLLGSWPVAVADLLDARAMMTVHVQDWKLSHSFDDLPTTDERNN
jgi:hypothetical protein